ncbi:hypothetical protein TWF694_003898 [Orbilia ellipsospora]
MPIRTTDTIDAAEQRKTIKNNDNNTTHLRNHHLDKGKHSNSNDDHDDNGGGGDNANQYEHEKHDGDHGYDHDDDKNNFDVECIVAEKKDPRSGKTVYLVNWKGFEEKDYTWEPKEHFHAADTLSDWEACKQRTVESERYDWRAWDQTYGEFYEDEDIIQNSEQGLFESRISLFQGDQTYPTHQPAEPPRSIKGSQAEESHPPSLEKHSEATRENIQLKDTIVSHIPPGHVLANSNAVADPALKFLPSNKGVTHISPHALVRDNPDLVSDASCQNFKADCKDGKLSNLLTSRHVDPISTDVKCILSINQGSKVVRAACKLTGLSLDLRDFIEAESIHELTIDGFVGFQYLEKIFIQESGSPAEKIFIEVESKSGNGMVTCISELQGAAVVRESNCTIIIAPSHAQRFTRLFKISPPISSELSAVVYPALKIPQLVKDSEASILPQEPNFLGSFLLGGANLCLRETFRGPQEIQIYQIPSACDLQYGHDIYLAFLSYWQKTMMNAGFFLPHKLLVPHSDMFSQKTKTLSEDHLTVFLVHRSLLRNLHLIPNMALLRSSNSSFFTFGPILNFGSKTIHWDIGSLFPYGGVLLLTLEVILQKAKDIKQILKTWSYLEATQFWALAIPENLTKLLEEALAMRALHDR